MFAGQLDVILGAVARVGEVAADDIPPTSHAVPLPNVFRPTSCARASPRSRRWPARRPPRTAASACRRSWGRRHERELDPH